MGSSTTEGINLSQSSLTFEEVLVHYDPSKELILACNASLYGVLAVFSHQMDLPFTYTSYCQKNITQLHKEARASVFIELNASTNT